jgi:transcriptional regulator with XRE-family HTH domain
MISISDAHVLGAAIRAGRSALDWSQLELAEKSGVSLPTVARIETGLNNPKLETISRLIGAIETAGVAYSWTHSNGFGMTVTLPTKKRK